MNNKIFTIKISRFNGGSSHDLRIKDTRKFAITKHFDALTFPHKLVPRVQSYLLNGEDKTFDIVKFLYAPATSEGAGKYRLYGFAKTASLKGAIYLLDMDNITGAWAKPTTAAYFDSGLSRSVPADGQDEKVFFYYKNYIYAWLGGQYLCRYDTTGAADWDDAVYDSNTTYTYLCQPVHPPSDDIAYFFYGRSPKTDFDYPLSIRHHGYLLEYHTKSSSQILKRATTIKVS